MSDPFDVFDPFAPLAPGDDAGSGAPATPDDPAARADRNPAPNADAAAPRTVRRWSVPRASAVPERPTHRPSPSEQEPEPEEEAATRSAPADLVDHAGSTALRAIALPEIQKAVERLSDRGHLADLENRLAEEDDPRLVVRFRPHSGPLGQVSLEPHHPWRFELRTAVEEDRTGDDRIQALAGYTAGSVDARFVALGRIPVRSLTPEWVSKRLVEFVERILGGS